MNFTKDKLSNFEHIFGSEQPKTGDEQTDKLTSLFSTLKCNFCDWRVSYQIQGDVELLVNPDYLRAICNMRDHIHNEHCEHFVPALGEGIERI